MKAMILQQIKQFIIILLLLYFSAIAYADMIGSAVIGSGVIHTGVEYYLLLDSGTHNLLLDDGSSKLIIK